MTHGAHARARPRALAYEEATPLVRPRARGRRAGGDRRGVRAARCCWGSPAQRGGPATGNAPKRCATRHWHSPAPRATPQRARRPFALALGRTCHRARAGDQSLLAVLSEALAALGEREPGLGVRLLARLGAAQSLRRPGPSAGAERAGGSRARVQPATRGAPRRCAAGAARRALGTGQQRGGARAGRRGRAPGG